MTTDGLLGATRRGQLDGRGWLLSTAVVVAVALSLLVVRELQSVPDAGIVDLVVAFLTWRCYCLSPGSSRPLRGWWAMTNSKNSLSNDVGDLLVSLYRLLQPLHTPAVVLLIILGLGSLHYDVPTLLWMPFLLFFSIMLAGNLTVQRRDQNG